MEKKMYLRYKIDLQKQHMIPVDVLPNDSEDLFIFREMDFEISPH